MRKIEVALPAGTGSAVAKVATSKGADDVLILNAHGPEADKDIVTITSQEKNLDEIVESISKYCKAKDLKENIRIWKTETPFIEIEDAEKARTTPLEELKAQVYEASTADITYIVLVILSAVLATLGLMQNSAIVIIGAMIIAPLLRPIMTASIATVTGDILLFFRGVTALFIGIVLAVSAVFIMGFAFPGMHPTPLVISISQLSLLTIAVAFTAGMIAAISMISNLSENMAGVAISVALVPPTAAVGINAFSWISGTGSLELLVSISLVLLMNIIAIDIGGSIVFYISRAFKASKQKTSLFSVHLAIAMLMLFMLSLPFIYTAMNSYQDDALEEEVVSLAQHYASMVAGEIDEIHVSFNPVKVKVRFISAVDPPLTFKKNFELELKNIAGPDAEAIIVYVKSESL